eukprot:TRINITY_DN5694_c0_g1_i1.p1 TRINITY_DN5694_c0_g1~~TRINITY_DN5694_c0_g1_i1.p1  ORF type:complete len:266 (+),score=64.00 TRINITY_DN5694_c0_g1_i1:23-799(+)
MRVMFIRHAQSENNELQAKIEDALAKKEIDGKEASRRWFTKRSNDADLTAKGKEESQKLGEYYARTLDEEDLVVYTSAMQRTCKTIQPLAGLLNLNVKVHPLLHEEGGIYQTDPDTMLHSVGPCNTGQDIANKFNYDVSLLPQDRPWFTQTHSGKRESRKECRERAKHMSDWLYAKDLHDEVGSKLLIIVCHQHFLTFLFSALLDIHNKPSMFLLGNTETAFARLDRGNRSAVFRWMGKSDHLTRFLSPRQGIDFAKL